PEGVVVDIGRASNALANVLSEVEYRNLDEVPAFNGKNTTTEFLAHFVFQRMAERLRAGDLGSGSAEITSMKVTLRESHVASASFEGAL
ncbi:MAG TPA: 6-carboxytetrahydropterin synthase, partial [Polyangiaceae bacterium]|nr:6-carboxytetrahydropterin synthase [Polyangiaceae bacterium]